MTSISTQMRLFFSLWPPDEVRKSIMDIDNKLPRKFTGKSIRSENLHLTLAFLGNVPADSLDCLLPMADSINFQSFKLTLDHISFFSRARVVCLGLKNEPVELFQLVGELTQGALACNIKMENSLYKPHITLMREVNLFNEHNIQPVSWGVNDFCLVSSMAGLDGVEYKVLHRWS